MEKKKILLVAISVGVFLVLTIGAAILVFTPKNSSAATLAAVARPVQGIDTGINVPAPAAGQAVTGSFKRAGRPAAFIHRSRRPSKSPRRCPGPPVPTGRHRRPER